MLNFLIACGGSGAAAASATGGCYDWPVIKQIIMVFGWAIEYIYKFFELIGIPNIALCIIIFTIVVKFILLPLTIRQQRFTKLNAYVQPEIRAIQAKYKGRTDAPAQQAIQAETKEVYAKYGISQMGGCLQSFIQLPIMIALYGAIRQMPLLIDTLKNSFINIINVLNGSTDAVKTALAQVSPGLFSVAEDGSIITAAQDVQITTLYSLPKAGWDTILSNFSGNDLATITANVENVKAVNTIAGIDISQSCWNLIFVIGGVGILAIIIPLLAGVAQWLSFKLSQVAGAPDAPGAAMSGKMMGLVMPLFSVYICLTLPASLGIYWAISSVFQVILQILVNKHYRKVDMEALIKKNQEKAAAKAARKRNKKGESSTSVAAAARTDTKNIVPPPMTISEIANIDVETGEGKKKVELNPTSLAAKAALVQQYNEEHGEEQTGTVARKKYKK